MGDDRNADSESHEWRLSCGRDEWAVSSRITLSLPSLSREPENPRTGFETSPSVCAVGDCRDEASVRVRGSGFASVLQQFVNHALLGLQFFDQRSDFVALAFSH
jgi:hypothetical protein